MRRRRIRRTPSPEPTSATERLRRRAAKLARRGDYRKAALSLRQLVALDGRARSWVAFGAMLSRANRDREALEAYKQGLWLLRREGQRRRAQTVARLILELNPNEPSASRVLRSR